MRNWLLVYVVLAWITLGGADLSAAVRWAPGWSNEATASGEKISEFDRSHARRLADEIDSGVSAREAIAAWEKIAAAEPKNAAAWSELGMLRLLEGAAFRERSKERLACYLAALQACERAMATNPEFLRRVRAGATTAQAMNALGAAEMSAMQFWSTGIFYIFRDCLGLVGRIVNFRLMENARTTLVHMDAIDPNWEESATTFSWGIYYLAMPASRGGDKAKARDYFDRAVALGEHRTLPRWGRAKYFYAATGEKDAARADLEWVAARSLDGLGGNRSWNRYFKAEAVRLLAERTGNLEAR
jgi:tetratricopeptide (TPR) repeat protein